MKIAYFVSRFPHVTETFILREFTGVDQAEDMSVELFSLFPASSTVVHHDARPWVPRLRTARASRVPGALAYWLRRRPAVMMRALATVFADYAASPRVLVRALATFMLSLDLARTVTRERVDHVHAHFATYPALAALVVKRLTDVPYSVTPHAHDIFIRQRGLHRKLTEAAFVVAISQFNRGFLRASSDVSTTIPVVRYGVDVEKFAYNFRERKSDELATALFVSSLRDYKGHRVLVEALAIDGEPIEGVRVLLVGEGPLRNEIQALANRRGVSHLLEFLGAQPEHVVMQLLRQSDVLLQPSIVAPSGDTEGLPNSLIEAMAAGVPVIGSDVTGIPELVRAGDTGTLCEAGNPRSLRSALDFILQNPETARERAVRGRRLVEQEYASTGRTAQLLSLFREARG